MMPPKMRDLFNALMGGALIGSFLMMGGAKSARAQTLDRPPTTWCSTYAYAVQGCYAAHAATDNKPTCSYAPTSGVPISLDWLASTPNLAFLNRSNGPVIPGNQCPAGTAGVFMSIQDYTFLISEKQVNETLGSAAIAIIGVMGFFAGYYIFGPRRRSIVEVAS